MAKFVVKDYGDSFACAILEAAGVDPTYVRRMVLDFPAGGPAMMYLETFADTAILDVKLADCPRVEIVTADDA